MIPHRCPKCNGVGWLPYDPLMPFATVNANAGPWQCPPCSGIGIIYESRPEELWTSGSPYPNTDGITWTADVAENG